MAKFQIDSKELESALQPVHDGIVDMQKGYSELQEWKAIKDDRDQKNQRALDTLIKKAQAVPMGESDFSFSGQLKYALADHFGSIQKVRKGYSHEFEIKAATMLESTHLTGSGAVRSYLDPSAKPGSGGINFRDLCQIVSTATGLITLPRETASSGSISRVPENTTKPQIDYTIDMKDYKADYIAGYARISKQMLQDLSFLQSWLPRLLLRDFNKAENAQFYGDLSSVATGSGTTSSTAFIEKVLDWISNLASNGFVPNGIVTTFSNYNSLLKTTSGSGGVYTLPSGVTVSADGAVRIIGVPIYPVSWVATGKTIVGDWTYATIAVADPLKVEFFEQDQDNVIKNLTTVRVESREVLVLENTDAFIHA